MTSARLGCLALSAVHASCPWLPSLSRGILCSRRTATRIEIQGSSKPIGAHIYRCDAKQYPALGIADVNAEGGGVHPGVSRGRSKPFAVTVNAFAQKPTGVCVMTASSATCPARVTAHTGMSTWAMHSCPIRTYGVATIRATSVCSKNRAMWLEWHVGRGMALHPTQVCRGYMHGVKVSAPVTLSPVT